LPCAQRSDDNNTKSYRRWAAVDIRYLIDLALFDDQFSLYASFARLAANFFV
jgi:hypothetical protein